MIMEAWAIHNVYTVFALTGMCTSTLQWGGGRNRMIFINLLKRRVEFWGGSKSSKYLIDKFD